MIDSKLSITAFDAHMNATTDAERAEALIRHSSSIRSHIRTLSSKEYHAVVERQTVYLRQHHDVAGSELLEHLQSSCWSTRAPVTLSRNILAHLAAFKYTSGASRV